MTDQIIDEDWLQSLEEDFGADGLGIVVDTYLEESLEIVDALGEGCSEGPDTQRVEHFHFLSGAAQNVGARRFGDLCRRLELENTGFSAEDYAAFRAEYDLVRDYFVARYQSAA